MLAAAAPGAPLATAPASACRRALRRVEGLKESPQLRWGLQLCRPGRRWALQASQRPPEEAQSWGLPSADWEELPAAETDEEDVDLFPQDGERTPEFFLQNALAVALLALLGLSAGNILLKLLFVSFALVSAAVRYTVVAVLIIVLFAIFV